MAKEKKTNIISKILKVLYYIVVSFTCLIVAFLLFYIISSQLHKDDENYKSYISVYTIVSPSMTPVINVYDVVINVRPEEPTDINVGDIITYKSAQANSEGMTITHRVIDRSRLPDGTYEYMTQGDNNSEPDSLYVTYDQVIGKEILIVPYIGKLQFLIANQKGWLIILLIPIVVYLFIEAYKLIDLFHLRGKVDRITGEVEESYKEKKEKARIETEQRKEKIKKELVAKEHRLNALIKNPAEPDNFLEKYSETVISVPVNKYATQQRRRTKIKLDSMSAVHPNLKVPQAVDATNVVENKTEQKELILPKTQEIEEIVPQPEEKNINHQQPSVSKTAVEEVSSKEVKTPKKTAAPKVIYENIEILDTDELTAKIKEYDSKINELDKIIKDMNETKELNKMIKDINNTKESVKNKNQLDNEYNYLLGGRLKVIDMTPAKKNKESDKIRIGFADETGVPTKNNRTVVERPESVDIAELRSEIKKDRKQIIEEPVKATEPTSKRKAKSINLNPKTIKKVNRPNRKKATPLVQPLKMDSLNIETTPVEPVSEIIKPIIPARTVPAFEPISPIMTPLKKEKKEQLNLNPNNIKKVSRTSKKVETIVPKKKSKTTKSKAPKEKKKRTPLIVIEKVPRKK